MSCDHFHGMRLVRAAVAHHLELMTHLHLHAVGDAVEWLHAPRNAIRGVYNVTRLLPSNDNGDLQYRIRSEAEVSERVVTELQICSRLSPAGSFRTH